LNRIFIYELKRLIFNKFFLSMILITGLYGFMTLSREIIIGIAFTAPFSSWSFGAYLANVLPLLMTTLFLFIIFMYSNHEKQVLQLIFATPVDPVKFGLVKCSAIASGFIIMSLFVIVLSMVIYAVLFRFYHFGDFIIPAIITVIPCLLFFLGAALLLGSIKPNILYVLMFVVFLMPFIPLPVFFDLYGNKFFNAYPLTLPAGIDGEPAFFLPIPFILGKILFSAAGVIMFLAGIKRYNRSMG